MERYKAMAGSKGRAFTLQHCWKILEHCEKWKNRDQELKPKREDMLELDDTEEEDGGRNKEKPEGNKKAKERIKLEAEATNLGKKIEDMVKSKEVYMEKALQTKVLLADKKNAINQARWEAIREDDKSKHALEDRRIDREEKKAMMDLIANENKTMMMDPSTMDAFTREWWDMRREEIMERRRLARLQSHANGAGAPMGRSGGGDLVGGSGGGGSGGAIYVGDA
jgi:hypothetical protein